MTSRIERFFDHRQLDMPSVVTNIYV